MVSDTLPAVSSAHDQLLGDEGQQDGYMASGLRDMPIQRTSSCSSFGSEGAPFAAGGGGTNGYHHHGYQGLFRSQVPYCFSRSTVGGSFEPDRWVSNVVHCCVWFDLPRLVLIGTGLSLNFLHREFKGACLELPLIWHEEVSCGARSYTCTDMNRHFHFRVSYSEGFVSVQ